MFTGIIEVVGRFVSLEHVGQRVELEVDVGSGVASGVVVGDSVALDGCCLTVTAGTPTTLRFQAVPETWARTALADRKCGDRVNVERALRADARLGGHFVLGHVDGTGEVRELHREGDDVRMEVSCGPEVARALVPKGSVAVDGVSLTVVHVAGDRFSVALIPHTLAHTTLGSRSIGDRVNLEADVLGKYVLRHLERMTPGSKA